MNDNDQSNVVPPFAEPAVQLKACDVCNGTRCLYSGVIGDPPYECEACFDQQPEDYRP